MTGQGWDLRSGCKLFSLCTLRAIHAADRAAALGIAGADSWSCQGGPPPCFLVLALQIFLQVLPGTCQVEQSACDHGMLQSEP